MKNEQIFAGMPVLTLITNFSHEGEFEKIYMVMERKKDDVSCNQKRKRALPPIHSTWNGPALAQWRES
jgi:hypothetical protein